MTPTEIDAQPVKPHWADCHVHRDHALMPPRTVQVMSRFPTAPLVVAGLVGGFAVARYTGRRELGGVILVAAGSACGRVWLRSSGPGVMGLLLGVYAAAFGGSHALAKKIGAWPSVLTVTAIAAGATYALADRSTARF
jgi:hypothetical protein